MVCRVDWRGADLVFSIIYTFQLIRRYCLGWIDDNMRDTSDRMCLLAWLAWRDHHTVAYKTQSFAIANGPLQHRYAPGRPGSCASTEHILDGHRPICISVWHMCFDQIRIRFYYTHDRTHSVRTAAAYSIIPYILYQSGQINRCVCDACGICMVVVSAEHDTTTYVCWADHIRQTSILIFYMFICQS